MNLDYFLKKQEILLSKLNVSYIRKDYYEILAKKERLVGLIGARGVGKTTLLLQFVQRQDAKTLYLSADDVEFTNTNLYEIVDEFYAIGGKVVIIDEIHRYRNWAQEIKNIYDSFPDLTIRISGSSMINILYEKYDLSRRLVLQKMPVLSFKEYYELTKKIELPKLSFQEILQDGSSIAKELFFQHEDIYAEFKNYLQYGAYPFFMEGIEFFHEKLLHAIEKIIYEDIPSIKRIEYVHISFFEKLIYFMVMANKPYKLNLSKLSQELKISEPTLHSYIKILGNTDIFKVLEKVSKKISKKPKKLLFSNTNILYAYADRVGIAIDIGVVRETFFVSCFDKIYYSDVGDFLVQDYVFEIGGKSKSFEQIKDIPNSYLVVDTNFTAHPKKIPLWLFGLMR